MNIVSSCSCKTTVSNRSVRLNMLLVILFGYFLPIDLSVFTLPGLRLDLVILGLCIFLIPVLGSWERVKIKKPANALLFIACLYMLTIYSILISIFSLSLSSYAIVYLSVEIQYVVAALLFFLIFNDQYLLSEGYNARITGVIVFLVGISVVWMAYQLITENNRGYYGPSPVGLDGASASSGLFFYSATCFSLAFRSKYTKYIVLMSLIGGTLSLNRTFLYAQAILFGVYYVLMLRNYARIIFLIVIAVAIVVANNIGDNYVEDASITYSRFLEVTESLENRLNIMGLEASSGRDGLVYQLFGNGKGYYDEFLGFKLNMHTQFSRLLLELGWCGVVLWLSFFTWLFYQAASERSSVGFFYFSFLVSFGATFFSYDALSIPRAYLVFIIISVFFFVQQNRLSGH